MKLEIVTPECLIYSGTIDSLVAPGIAGVLGIYPNHCPLLTILQAGELKILKNHEEFYIVVGGGFMEVRKDKIIILADIAEREDEIIEQKVIEAKKYADQKLSQKNVTNMEKEGILESLRLEMIRLNIVEKRKKRKKLSRQVNLVDDNIFPEEESR